MQDYIAPRKLETQSALINWVKPNFKNVDFAITLTFKPDINQYRLNYVPDYRWYSSHVHHYLNIVNRTMIGRASNRPLERLKVAYTFELNFSEGVHVHMILEARENCKIPKMHQPMVLKSCWQNVHHSGLPQAQIVEPCWDSAGWVEYLMKDVSRKNNLHYDVQNWNF